ncbi:MAG: SH3 domain-containing protein [Anaerolineae bacterium]|nr:SH3 domain-containing protein [Anaerolineae bacterium]
MRIRLMIAIVALLLVSALAVAQDESMEVSDATCSPILEQVWTTASDACVAGPTGYICNGGRAPLVQPDGPVRSALSSIGALVEAQEVDLLQTAPLSLESSNGGVAWLRLSDPLALTGLLVGHVAVMDVSPPDFPPWQSMVVVTGSSAPVCGIAPHNVFIAQTPIDQSTNFVVNGVSIILNGTLMVETQDSATLFLTLSGSARVLSKGQEQQMPLGEQVTVAYNSGDYFTPIGPPSVPELMDTSLIQNVPVALLDVPVLLPQPGYVSTRGLVNVRAEPSVSGALLGQVPAGEVLSVLGRNPSGDWYHVRLNTGETGWMFADLLVQNVGDIQAVYEATPQMPQRYGLMGQLARVIAPAGINVRRAPDVSFALAYNLTAGAEVTLLARSPYSPWVKIQSEAGIGWAALITLDTEAIINALPIDYDVPPPPVPTQVPGSFGNAFPDPRGGG